MLVSQTQMEEEKNVKVPCKPVSAAAPTRALPPASDARPAVLTLVRRVGATTQLSASTSLPTSV